MPLWAKIYIATFLLFTIANMGYYIYMKSKPLIVFYDFFCGIFLMLAMVSYWRPVLKENLGIYGAIIFIFVIGIEFYLSALGGYKKLGVKMPEGISEEELDNAFALSIFLAAPAYICGGLSMLEVAAKYLKNI